MAYRIAQNYFSPMCNDTVIDEFYRPSHALSYDKCNFNCCYCDFRNRDRKGYHEYDSITFSVAVELLAQKGNVFKFTGGESTLNPNLESDLRAVRNIGGRTFVDSNGTDPEKIKKLLDEKLVDVLGISLKGLDAKEAMTISGIPNEDFCFNNVFRTIKTASEYEDVRLIVTYVCYNEITQEKLEKFASLIIPYKNVYLKVNNMFECKKQRDIGLSPIPREEMHNAVALFAENHPEWKGRIILVNTKEAIGDFEKIVFF